ncbi:MAG: sigma-70 family RNA polymerase sigma factor [Bacteroidota bacterium]
MEVNSKLTDKAQRDYLLVRDALDNGNQKAYAELMNCYRDALYFMLLKMTNDPYDAEDLTIEAFGKAFKCLTLYTPDYAFSTWLFKIATNNCIDYLRSKKKNTVSLDTAFGNDSNEGYTRDVACETLNPEASCMEKQKALLMRKMVEKLKPNYRILVDLRYFQEHSYEEIAEELHLPLGTVKAQLFRARDMMYKLMKDSHETI